MRNVQVRSFMAHSEHGTTNHFTNSGSSQHPAPIPTHTPKPTRAIPLAGEALPRSPSPITRPQPHFHLKFPTRLFSSHWQRPPRRVPAGCWQALSTAVPHAACTLHAGGLSALFQELGFMQDVPKRREQPASGSRGTWHGGFWG